MFHFLSAVSLVQLKVSKLPGGWNCALELPSGSSLNPMDSSVQLTWSWGISSEKLAEVFLGLKGETWLHRFTTMVWSVVSMTTSSSDCVSVCLSDCFRDNMNCTSTGHYLADDWNLLEMDLEIYFPFHNDTMLGKPHKSNPKSSQSELLLPIVIRIAKKQYWGMLQCIYLLASSSPCKDCVHSIKWLIVTLS